MAGRSSSFSFKEHLEMKALMLSSEGNLNLLS
ncbi:hypothetical protein ACO22_07853 [Paracoccidioides brasiliensis]|uniref:Uncharacterized protein n=1 Tax=Paracoccidioides brasiliensis TaxID=121759 RepID=A0A1D2J3H3_PARBR|nr:hypothetical protein ACO22_07853 [Paracoccidioides brasiliensis]